MRKKKRERERFGILNTGYLSSLIKIKREIEREREKRERKREREREREKEREIERDKKV